MPKFWNSIIALCRVCVCAAVACERTYNSRKFTFDDDDLSENTNFFATTAQMLDAHAAAREQRKATERKRVKEAANEMSQHNNIYISLSVCVYINEHWRHSWHALHIWLSHRNSMLATNSKITVTHSRPILSPHQNSNIISRKCARLGSNAERVSGSYFGRIHMLCIGVKHFTGSRTIQPICIWRLFRFHWTQSDIHRTTICPIVPACTLFPAVRVAVVVVVVAPFCFGRSCWAIQRPGQYLKHHRVPCVSCRAQFWHNEVDAASTHIQHRAS